MDNRHLNSRPTRVAPPAIWADDFCQLDTCTETDRQFTTLHDLRDIVAYAPDSLDLPGDYFVVGMLASRAWKSPMHLPSLSRANFRALCDYRQQPDDMERLRRHVFVPLPHVVEKLSSKDQSFRTTEKEVLKTRALVDAVVQRYPDDFGRCGESLLPLRLCERADLRFASEYAWELIQASLSGMAAKR
jgi:hypothetical protein